MSEEEDEQTGGLMEQAAVLAQVSAPPLSPMAAKATTESLMSPDLARIRSWRRSGLSPAAALIAMSATPAHRTGMRGPLTKGAREPAQCCR